MSLPSRYRDVPVLSIDGVRSLGLRPPPGNVPAGGWLHTWQEGDSLDLLARQYYGQEALWWLIADANPTRFPEDWRPGDQLRVPPLIGASTGGAR